MQSFLFYSKYGCLMIVRSHARPSCVQSPELLHVKSKRYNIAHGGLLLKTMRCFLDSPSHCEEVTSPSFKAFFLVVGVIFAVWPDLHLLRFNRGTSHLLLQRCASPHFGWGFWNSSHQHIAVTSVSRALAGAGRCRWRGHGTEETCGCVGKSQPRLRGLST
jgi:hypothetical protein